MISQFVSVSRIFCFVAKRPKGLPASILKDSIIFNQFPACSEPGRTETLSLINLANLRMESFNVGLIFSFLVCLVILVAKARFIHRILKANTDVNVFNHSIALCFALSGEISTFSFTKSHIRQERVKPAEFLEDVFYAGIGGLVCIPTTIWLISPHFGEETFNKTSAPGDNVADDTGDHGDDAAKTDRLLPCWILFLVRTKTIFQLLFFPHR